MTKVLVVIAGAFRLRLADRPIDAKAGDVIWIPKGTSVAHEEERAEVVYILYLVNWLALNGNA